MSQAGKTTITILISLVLAGALIWWTMRDTDFDSVWQSLQHANYLYVGLSVLLGLLAYLFRSERWRLLLQPLGYNPKSSNAFAAVCMNYFWNLLIPRSGELARCTSLFNMDKTPVDKSFGTVISERVIDFICLIIVAILTVIFNFNILENLFGEISAQKSTKETNNNTLYYVLTAIVLIAVTYYFMNVYYSKSRIFRRFKIFIYGLRKGLKSIFLLRKKWVFIIYTIGIWVCYYLMTYLMVFALPESAHLGPEVGLYLLFVGGIGMVIPASGGLGAFHAAMRLGFIALGLSAELGVTFGFLVHTPHTLLALILGIISFFIVFGTKKA